MVANLGTTLMFFSATLNTLFCLSINSTGLVSVDNPRSCNNLENNPFCLNTSLAVKFAITTTSIAGNRILGLLVSSNNVINAVRGACRQALIIAAIPSIA